MAGKNPVLASHHLYLALDVLSKNQLIDFVVDMARAELGESATDAQVIAWIQPKIATIWNHRGDKYQSLQAAYDRRKQNEERFITEWEKANGKPYPRKVAP